MPFFAIQQDITTMQVDAIVNAANASLLPGGGVCGAIFAKAGYKDLAAACKAIGGCAPGQAVITRLCLARCLCDPYPRPRVAGRRPRGSPDAGQLLCKQLGPRPKVWLPLHRFPLDFRRHLWLSDPVRPGDRSGYHKGLAGEHFMDVYLCLLDKALVWEAERLFSA